MNPLILAGLVKRIYPLFNMELFGDRVKLQKFIYLTQGAGLNLGYNFSLYLHGPYCPTLAREGFDMPKVQDCEEIYFGEEEHEHKFNDLIKFLSEYKEDPNKMEILASLYLFHKINPESKDKELVDQVKKKDEKFKEKGKLIESLLKKIKESNVIQW